MLLLVPAGRAAAQPLDSYRADLRLRTGYEMVEVKDGAGGSLKNSTWLQEFMSNASGPLVSPALGSGAASFEFSSGDDLSLIHI